MTPRGINKSPHESILLHICYDGALQLWINDPKSTKPGGSFYAVSYTDTQILFQKALLLLISVAEEDIQKALTDIYERITHNAKDTES